MEHRSSTSVGYPHEASPSTSGTAPFTTYPPGLTSVPFVIGVAGGSGAGKTTVVEGLRTELSHKGVAVLDQDSYYKDQSHISPADRDALNFDDPAALDHDLLALHVEQLRAGNRIAKPVYCFSTHTRTREVQVIPPAPFVIVEGIFALCDPHLRSLMDLKLYIDADPDVRFIRRLKRDIVDRGRTAQSVITQYLETVRPMHLKHIQPTRSYADLVVDCTGSLGPALRQINIAIDAACNARVATSASIACQMIEVR